MTAGSSVAAAPLGTPAQTRDPKLEREKKPLQREAARTHPGSHHDQDGAEDGPQQVPQTFAVQLH